MIFNIARKIVNLFGIQLLKVTTYKRLVRKLSTESEANVELSDALLKSLYKEQYEIERSRILIKKINSFKNSYNNLHVFDNVHYLDVSSVSNEAFTALDTQLNIPSFVQERASPNYFKSLRTLFEASNKASYAINYLQSKYVDDTTLITNDISIIPFQSEHKTIFFHDLKSKRNKALKAITMLDSKYFTTLQGSKYYE